MDKTMTADTNHKNLKQHKTGRYAGFYVGLFFGLLVFCIVPGSLLVTFPINESHAADQTTRFLQGFDDIPLPNGFVNAPTTDETIFETPYGRFLEGFAVGPGNKMEVIEFYNKTLPQMGWKRGLPQHFLRGGEELSLDFTRQGDMLTVRFTLQPHEEAKTTNTGSD